jgi:glutamate synthase domain-containing protein 3
MTGGTVVILGKTGRNFGAGMTGGAAYVLDEANEFEKLYNPQLVGLQRVSGPEDVNTLQSLILRHQAMTDSLRAQEVLGDWDSYLPQFWKVLPHPGESLPLVKTAQKSELGESIGAR